MFVQVIQGRVKDAAGMKKQWDKWEQELKPGSIGYLGGTAGVTEDGEFFICARFESQEAAQKNSDRPEQGKWWSETEGYIENPTFHDCTEVTEWLKGGSDDAGFVQIIQGRTTDTARMLELSKDFEAHATKTRPDIIGGYHADHGDGGFTSVNYFTSEKEARAGEKGEMPADLQATFQEWQTLMSDVKFNDLRDPWLSSP